MAEEFSRSVARVVAAQVAEGAGFDACQDSAIEILADLLLRYLSTICASSHSYAELAGRSQSNLADALLALEELGVTADDLHQHMELQKTDIPFAHTLAPYPVHTQRPVPPTFADQKEPHPAHIPSFLPAFPDPHTYQHTAAYAGHEGDPYKQRQSMLEAKQKGAAALTKLNQRMISKVAQPDINPFLAAPTIEQLPAQLPVPLTAAAAGANGAAAGDGAVVNGSSSDAAAKGVAQQQHVQLVQQLQQQLQQQVEMQPDEELDEDALFEQAAVLKAFSSILPLEMLKERQAGPDAQQQQQQEQQDGVIEEQPMDIDGGAGAGAGPGSDAVSSWLGWKQHQQGAGAAAGAAAAAMDGVAGAELLRFGIDPLAAGKQAALSLAGKQRPPDVYAERGKVAAAGGGSRSRKSKYDADPKLKQAEGILNAGPETVFETVGRGVHAMFETGEDLELD